MMTRSIWLKLIVGLLTATLIAYVLALIVIAGRPGDLWVVVAVLVSLTFLANAAGLFRQRRARRRIAGFVLDLLEQAILLNLPLPRTMAALADDRGRGADSELRAIPIDLAGGASLATTLARHTALPPQTIRAIDAAEQAGQLDRVVPALAAARRQAMANRVRAGEFYRVYPLLVIIVLIGVLQMLRVFVGPKFAQIFKDFHQPLPWITQITMDAGGHNGDSILFLCLLLAIVLWLGRMVRGDRQPALSSPRLGWMSGTFFIWNRARREDSWADAFFFIADGLEDQRHLPTTLQMAAELSRDAVVRAALRKWRDELTRGVPLDQAARSAGLPDLFAALTDGQAPASDLIPELRFAGEHYRHRAKQIQAWIHLAIAPAAALSLGLLVAWVALSVMLPLTRLTDVMNARAMVVR